MRLPVLTPLCLCLGLSAAPAAFAAPADDCAAIVSATLEEMHVAAGEGWDAGQEALARRAAAAACVKSRSGRYDAMTSETIDVRNPGSGGTADAEAGEQAREEGGSATAEADKEDSGLWPFGEFKINDVSASPSKKPYERRRLDNDD
jgi:hypothetical protein